MNLSDISAHWVALHEALGLGAPIADEAQYERALETMETLMEQLDLLEATPLGGLASLLADRIREYEAQAHPWPGEATPAQVLEFLMEAHGLAQRDLPEIGAQSVVSAVLAGKRSLNLRQVKALAARFHVPMEAFAG
jgi:HTH-type transcriptional regulator/antitoxin HigA